MGSTSDHQVASRLIVANPVAAWSPECQLKQEHGQSGRSVRGVWMICPEHVCTRNCGDHVRQPESHSGTDVGRTEAIQVSDRHRFSPPRHQASGHKMLSARRTANLHCEAMWQPKMIQTVTVMSDWTYRESLVYQNTRVVPKCLFRWEHIWKSTKFRRPFLQIGLQVDTIRTGTGWPPGDGVCLPLKPTRGSAMAEGPRDALVSRNSATTVKNIPFEN